MAYNPQRFEQKWRDYWEQNQVSKVEIDSNKKKFYCLDMFPYPSGKGLHVGHPLGYITSDIISRYKKMCGYNVLHPMGYDAFGLPAEQFAIQTGVHPADSTEKNIERYTEQLKMLGLNYDWSRSIKTCDPEYYKWTQWIFSQMFEHYYDIAEDKAKPIQALAEHFNRQGTDSLNAYGAKEHSFSAAEWSAFSDLEKQDVLMNYRLAYRNIAYVNWCEELKTVLANDEVKDGLSERGGFPVIKKPMEQWSLRTSAYADRLLNGLKELEWSTALKIMQENWIGKSTGARIEFAIDQFDDKLEIYTTRPDTIFGASFMVMAPELELVGKISSPAQKRVVEDYIKYVGSRSERERMSEHNDMSGVFTGAYSIHPINGEKIPIYISEYVLKDYGTGAIMAVPDGDERDKRFASKFGLPIPQIQEEKEGKTVAVNSQFLDGLEKESAIEKMIEYLEKEGLGKAEVRYKLRDANFSRQRYWGEPFPIAYGDDGLIQLISTDELPVELPDTEDFLPSSDGHSPLAKVKSWVEYNGASRETDTMPGYAGSSWYYFRYMDPNNSESFASEEAKNYWGDVDLYIGGAEHAVGHLLYARMWCKFLYDIGHSPIDEPFRKLVNQGMIQGRSSFVYRANENFAEGFLRKLLQKNISSFESNVLIEGEDGHTFSADFACTLSKVVIELKSVVDLQRYFNKRKKSIEGAGYIFLPISIEEVFYNYHTPEVLLDKITGATKSQDILEYCCNTALFVSRDMVEEERLVSRLHVDISMVEHGDKLDMKAFGETRKDLNQVVFITNEKDEYICGHQIEKMSKSKFNVVNPDDVVAKYGTDCFRLYEMFLGPIEQSKPWDTQNIGGVSKFLNKFYALFYDQDDNLKDLSDDEPSKEELKVLHCLLKKLQEDLERLSMNTCVSAMMIAVNDLMAIKSNNKAIMEKMCLALAPFAPHLAEELWQFALGNSDTVMNASFPDFNPQYLVESTIEYPLCINGKKRAVAEFDRNTSREDLEKAALELESLHKWLENKNVVKVIVVPNRMINVVVK